MASILSNSQGWGPTEVAYIEKKKCNEYLEDVEYLIHYPIYYSRSEHISATQRHAHTTEESV